MPSGAKNTCYHILERLSLSLVFVAEVTANVWFDQTSNSVIKIANTSLVVGSCWVVWLADSTNSTVHDHINFSGSSTWYTVVQCY